MKNAFFLSASLAALFCLAASPAIAQYNQKTHHNYAEGTVSPLSGVYAGAFGGYTWADADVSSGGGKADLNGDEYGVFLGYQLDTLLDKSLGLGINGALEIYYAWSDLEDTTSAGVEVEKDNEWGISFRPGLSFVDRYTPLGLKPYGIVGYRRAEYETAGGDEIFDGFELGLGTELIAYQDFGVRLDYTHVWYSEEEGLDPDEDNLRLGVAYHF